MVDGRKMVRAGSLREWWREMFGFSEQKTLGVHRKLHSAVSTAPEGHAGLLRHPTRLQHLAMFSDEGSHAALAHVGFPIDWYEHPR